MGQLTWPLAINEIRGNKENNTFGMVRNNGKRAHQGWDFKAVVGTMCYALAEGKVEFVDSKGDYGNQVCIAFAWKENQTLYAFYAHMHAIMVTPGQQVRINDRIGTTGKSGNAESLAAIDDHLHFEIRTIPRPGLGLVNRMSPLKLYGTCPMTGPQDGNQIITF